MERETGSNIPLLAEEGWMRQATRGADGVVSSAETFRRPDHSGASRHPSSARRGIFLVAVLGVIVVISPLFGQMSQEKVDLDAIYRIKDEGLNRSQMMETVS